MEREKKRISLRTKKAILILLFLAVFGLSLFYYQAYSNSYAAVQADSQEYWADNLYQANIVDLDQDKEEERKASGTLKTASKALLFPQVDDLPPYSDTASWQGIAPLEEGKVIEIILSVQRLLAWQDGELIGNFLTSTGKPGFQTLQGSFRVLSKLKMAYGSGDGDLWGMPYWIGFYLAGGSENGIHALPYINGYKEGHGSLGHAVSHGCVRIADVNQIWLYHWAEIGTPVIVHWQIDLPEEEEEEETEER